MKTNIKPSAREALMELEEQSIIKAMRIDRAARSTEERIPEFTGQPGRICMLPDGELETHLAHLGNRNLANAFANDYTKALANFNGLANEDRFTASYFSTPLTAYTVGWQDPENLEALVDFLCPRVPVQRRFEYKLAINKERFFSGNFSMTSRAIGSEASAPGGMRGASTRPTPAKTINRVAEIPHRRR